MNPTRLVDQIAIIDAGYSQRFIALDPNGYFIIKVNQASNEIIAEHYSNDIDETGTATDPDTGKPLGCCNNKKRDPIKVYKGRSAKELGMELSERGVDTPISSIDHGLYMGRELQKAEHCLIHKVAYIQD